MMDNKVESGTLTSSKVNNQSLKKVHSLILTHDNFILKNEPNISTYEHKKTNKSIVIKVVTRLESSFVSYIFTYEPSVEITVSVSIGNSGKLYKTVVDSFDSLYMYLDNYFNETINILSDEDDDKEQINIVLDELKSNVVLHSREHKHMNIVLDELKSNAVLHSQ